VIVDHLKKLTAICGDVTITPHENGIKLTVKFGDGLVNGAFPPDKTNDEVDAALGKMVEHVTTQRPYKKDAPKPTSGPELPWRVK